jgi:beta-glucosidase
VREADLPASDAKRWPGVDTVGAPVSASAPASFGGSGMPTRVEYTEGLRIGYRWFDANAIAPRFPFGFGLSYTTFALTKLAVSQRVVSATTPLTVSVRVTNTGKRRGAEVPQVYLGLPSDAGEPPKRLVAFRKVWLDPGQSTTVRMTIDPGATSHPLSVWDETAQRWLVRDGSYVVFVGTSSAGMFLSDTLRVRAR